MPIEFSEKKGFTLIELLVVISIIGLLSSLAIMGFSISRQKSRDGKRYSDLNALSKAIQIYQIDKGSYPAPETTGTNSFEYSHADDNFLKILLDEGYVGENIIDPINSDLEEQYYFYGRFDAGEDIGGTVIPCETSWGQYYILGVADLEGFTEAERPNPRNAVYTCGAFTVVQNNYDYYTGNFGEK